MAAEQGVPRGEVGGLDLPSARGSSRTTVGAGKRRSSISVVISRWLWPDLAAVGAGHREAGLDDPDLQPVQVRQVGAVGQVAQDVRISGWICCAPAAARRWPRPHAECVGVEGPTSSKMSMPGRSGGGAGAGPRWPRPGRPPTRARGADQAAGAGLGQGHQPQHGMPGEAIRYLIRPSQQQFRPVLRDLGEFPAIKAVTVRSPPKRTCRVQGWASGPATTSNRPSAVPGRAGGAGHADLVRRAPAHPGPPARRSASRTRAYPRRREHPQRQQEYTPVLDGRSRSRRAAPSWSARRHRGPARTAGTRSARRCPGAETSGDRVTAWVMVVADSYATGPLASGRW